MMTSYDEIFAGASTQTVSFGFRNLHAKNYAFSTMCEIPLLFNTISQHCVKLSKKYLTFTPSNQVIKNGLIENSMSNYLKVFNFHNF